MSKFTELTPENCDCSQLACNIVNSTFLSLDGFEPLRRSMNDDWSYSALAFAAELARITDRELKTAKESVAN